MPGEHFVEVIGTTIVQRFTFDNTEGALETCSYNSFISSGFDSLPNAPGGLFGCSNGNIPCIDVDGNVVNGSDINVLISSSTSFIEDDAFCPDMISWYPEFVGRSALTNDNDSIVTFCKIWGQDVGIVNKSVQTCYVNICTKWWSIIGNSIALAFGIEFIIVLLIIIFYKLRKHKNEVGTTASETVREIFEATNIYGNLK